MTDDTTKEGPAKDGLSKFSHGAVAVIDALGFKGIWNNKNPDDVLATLERAKENAKRNEAITRDFVSDDISIRFFSDGVVITSTGPDADQSLWHVVTTSAAIMAGALISPVHLAYRGCVAYGPIIVRDDFYIGRAIDEAAEAAPLANAAVVWLAPSALAKVGPGTAKNVVTWEVPLKSGGAIETRIVNIFPQFHLSKVTDEEVIRRCLATFDAKPSIDVTIKKQNTRKALDACLAAHRSPGWQ